jgi:hypothetical protein
MDFEPTAFLLSFVVSGVGFVAFMYGRKQKRLPQMVAGVLLMVYPYFVSTPWIMIAIAVAVLAATYGIVRLGA